MTELRPTSRSPEPGAPLWDRPGAEPEVSEPLPSLDRADVVVVGGGYTGLSTALHCAQAGLSVQVIEAGRIGQGGSGRNVGLVNAGLWLPPSVVAAALGPVRGPRFVQRFGDAPDRVFDLIEAHQIRCAATRTGTIHAAHAASAMAGLGARAAAWQALGAPVTLLDRTEVARRTGTGAFHGGLLDARAGTVDPMGYARGLARAARAAGARIATGLRATGLAPRPAGGWIVRTGAGTVHARSVVLATNAYSDALWPGLAGTYSTISFVQFATRPLVREAAHVLPGRQGVWDTGRIMVSLRRDADDRIVIGSMGRLHGSAAAGLSHRWARRQIARLFPELAGIGFEAAWDGRIAMTPDHLPRLCVPAPDLYAPLGYNGRGITTGTLFGAELAALLSGGDPADLSLPLSSPRAVRAGRLRAAVLDAAFAMNQLARGL